MTDLIRPPPRVLNEKTDPVAYGAALVTRETKWGNPWSHLTRTRAKFRVATREEAVATYERWIRANPSLMAEARRELRGRDLICGCAPLPCHADVLLRIANEDP